MNCPRDDAAFRQVVRKGTTIDVCDACGGRWLDEGELEQLIIARSRAGATAARLKSALASAERSAFFRDAGGDADLTCPRCEIGMRKVRFESGGAELTADRCANCHGFWLDAGETGSLFVFLEERLPVRGIVWLLVGVALALLAALWLLRG